jgi:hypothetical protein
MVPRQQTLNVVAVGSVSAKGILVEQALNAAARTYLVGTALGPDGPAHFAMPAAAEEYRDPGDSGRNQPNGPEPTGALSFLRLLDFFHRNPDQSGELLFSIGAIGRENNPPKGRPARARPSSGMGLSIGNASHTEAVESNVVPRYVLRCARVIRSARKDNNRRIPVEPLRPRQNRVNLPVTPCGHGLLPPQCGRARSPPNG